MAEFYRKALVLGSINCVSFSNGFLLAQSAGMVQSLRRRQEGIDITDTQISVVASSVMLLCVLGMGLAAVASDKVGRRWSFMIFSAPLAVNYIILFYARDMLNIMISRTIAGTASGALFALKLCVTSEYAGAKTRAVFLNMISTLAPGFGSAAGHALGNTLHWRTVALIGIIPSSVGVFAPYFWEESPHWLASKGRFLECEESFRRLHGSTHNAESELEILLKVEKSKLQKAKETNSMRTLRKLSIACRKKYFWDLMALGVFISAYIAAGGKVAFSVLAVPMLTEITGSSDIFLFTIAVDAFVILGATASCFLIKKMSMRAMLFTTSIIAISILVTFSASLYFKSESIYHQWTNVGLLSIYFFIIKCGPYPVLEALLGEIFPLELKVYLFFIAGTVTVSSIALSIFLLPIIVKVLGYHGLFLINAGIMSLSLGYIWLRLPETKGRTLQEIEIFFKTKNFHEIDAVLGNEQVKALI